LNKLITDVNANDFHFKYFETDISPSDIPSMTKILIDGNWIGFTESPISFLRVFKEMRTSEVGNIPIEVSINLDYVNKEIRIFTDAGRCMRPLFVVD